MLQPRVTQKVKVLKTPQGVLLHLILQIWYWGFLSLPQSHNVLTGKYCELI